jgi:hypothetical protein
LCIHILGVWIRDVWTIGKVSNIPVHSDAHLDISNHIQQFMASLFQSGSIRMALEVFNVLGVSTLQEIGKE